MEDTILIYQSLPIEIIKYIYNERNIDYTCIPESTLCEILVIHDSIEDFWIKKVIDTKISQIHTLSVSQLYFYGIYHGCHGPSLMFFKTLYTTKNYIRICYWWKQSTTKYATGLDVHNYQREIIELNDTQAIYTLFTQIFPAICKIMIRFLTIREIKMALLVNNCYHIDLDKLESLKQRYLLLKHCNYPEQILSLYPNAGEKSTLFDIARTEIHPFEKIICTKEEQIDCNYIIDTLKMLIPPKYKSHEIASYIQKNIAYYTKVVDRGLLKEKHLSELYSMIENGQINAVKDYLEKLTDSELFNLIGMYIHYDGRESLIKNVLKHFTKKGFMMPLEIKQNSCKNILTPITNECIFEFKTIPMICYGTIGSHWVYEIQELIDSFLSDEIGNKFFYKPHRPKSFFRKKQLKALQFFLSSYKHCAFFTKEEEILIKTLYKSIKTYTISLCQKLESDTPILACFQELHVQDKKIYKKILKNMFYTGMLMRRWKGKGFAFPIKEVDTLDPMIPDTLVSLSLQQGEELKESLSENGKLFYDSIPLCEYYEKNDPEDRLQKGVHTFVYLKKEVMHNNYCIRIASSKFIYTAHHYMSILYQQYIEDIDVFSIEKIQ